MIFIDVFNAQNFKYELINLTSLYTNANKVFFSYIEIEGIYEDCRIIYVGY